MIKVSEKYFRSSEGVEQLRFNEDFQDCDSVIVLYSSLTQVVINEPKGKKNKRIILVYTQTQTKQLFRCKSLKPSFKVFHVSIKTPPKKFVLQS